MMDKNKLEFTKKQQRELNKFFYEKGMHDFQVKYCPNCVWRKGKVKEELVIS